MYSCLSAPVHSIFFCILRHSHSSIFLKYVRTAVRHSVLFVYTKHSEVSRHNIAKHGVRTPSRWRYLNWRLGLKSCTTSTHRNRGAFGGTAMEIPFVVTSRGHSILFLAAVFLVFLFSAVFGSFFFSMRHAYQSKIKCLAQGYPIITLSTFKVTCDDSPCDCYHTWQCILFNRHCGLVRAWGRRFTTPRALTLAPSCFRTYDSRTQQENAAPAIGRKFRSKPGVSIQLAKLLA